MDSPESTIFQILYKKIPTEQKVFLIFFKSSPRHPREHAGSFVPHLPPCRYSSAQFQIMEPFLKPFPQFLHQTAHLTTYNCGIIVPDHLQQFVGNIGKFFLTGGSVGQTERGIRQVNFFCRFLYLLRFLLS